MIQRIIEAHKLNRDSPVGHPTHLHLQFSEKSIVIGCNYHTKWQKHSSMRFVLKEIKGDKARLITRTSRRDFWTNVSDLIFIMSKHNIDKAIRLTT